MSTKVRAINVVYMPQTDSWILLRDNFCGEYKTFAEVLVTLAKAKWFENWL